MPAQLVLLCRRIRLCEYGPCLLPSKETAARAGCVGANLLLPAVSVIGADSVGGCSGVLFSVQELSFIYLFVKASPCLLLRVCEVFCFGYLVTQFVSICLSMMME